MIINYNMKNRSGTIPSELTLGISLVSLILISSINKEENIENFTNGFGFELPDSSNPIFKYVFSKFK